MDGGSGWTTMRMNLKPQNCTSKNGEEGEFQVYSTKIKMFRTVLPYGTYFINVTNTVIVILLLLKKNGKTWRLGTQIVYGGKLRDLNFILKIKTESYKGFH